MNKFMKSIMTSPFFLFLILILFISSCSVQDVLYEENFNMRFSVKRAMSEKDSNMKIYTNKESVSWVSKYLYVRLLPADILDNTTANPTTKINGFNQLTDAPNKVLDPLDTGLTINITDLPIISESVAILGTGKDSQTIAYVDFYGVKEGIYDVFAFADIETNLDINTTTHVCTCTRATGCNLDDYETYEVEKNAGNCTSLVQATKRPMPSNGDLFYVIDNIVVSTDTKDRLMDLSLRHDADTLLAYGTTEIGDGDVWNEWKCIYHYSTLPGYNLHNYTFPDDGSDQYCLPGTTDCGLSSEDGSNSTYEACGTLMDYGFDYNSK